MINEVWLGDKHKKQSIVGTNNRKKLPYNHTMGTRSFSAAMSIEEIEKREMPHIVDFYKTSHWSKKKNDWISPVCEVLHDKMEQLREASSQPGASPMTQEEITIEVLVKRSGCLRGYGVGPKPSYKRRSEARDEEVKSLKAEIARLNEKIDGYEGEMSQPSVKIEEDACVLLELSGATYIVFVNMNFYYIFCTGQIWNVLGLLLYNSCSYIDECICFEYKLHIFLAKKKNGDATYIAMLTVV